MIFMVRNQTFVSVNFIKIFFLRSSFDHYFSHLPFDYFCVCFKLRLSLYFLRPDDCSAIPTLTIASNPSSNDAGVIFVEPGTEDNFYIIATADPG